MNRSYTIEQYKKLVKKIRKEFVKVRGKDTFFCLTTDIIVGFPGETKKQFENTIKLFKEIKFDMAYISQYSSRFGTATFGFKDDISQKEKKERDKILTEILKKTALENNKKYIGREIKVLFEKEKNGFLIGKSEQYKTVKCQMPRPHRYVSQPATDAVLLAGVAKRCGRANPKSQMPKLIGDFVKVKITEANSWGLKGDAS